MTLPSYDDYKKSTFEKELPAKIDTDDAKLIFRLIAGELKYPDYKDIADNIVKKAIKENAFIGFATIARMAGYARALREMEGAPPKRDFLEAAYQEFIEHSASEVNLKSQHQETQRVLLQAIVGEARKAKAAADIKLLVEAYNALPYDEWGSDLPDYRLPND